MHGGERLSRVLALALTAASFGALADDGPTARFPKGLRPMALPLPPSDLKTWKAEECVGCHLEQAEDHALSAHAVARSNAVFRTALLPEQPQWCIGCHAPQSTGAGDALEESGVTCGACHAAEGGVAATSSSGRAPHAVVVTPALRDGTLCAACHQFGFSLRDHNGALTGVSPTRPQQDTFAEWTRWKEQTGDARGCADCHAGGHAFGGRHPIDALRAAVVGKVKGRVLEVSSVGVGHALPTGDVMRWLSVEFSSDPLFEHAVVAAGFGLELGTKQWPGEELPRVGVLGDTRLFGSAPRRVPIPRAVDGRPTSAWRIVYHLISDNQEHRRNLPLASSRIVLHTEVLP